MTGWDSWHAIPIDWHLTCVVPTIYDETEAFVYSDNLWSTHALPELWVSCLGTCGHRVSEHGAADVLNEIARRMIAGDLRTGGEHAVPFDSGAVLRFEVGLPKRGRWCELETYCADQDAPVIEVRWCCCQAAHATAS